MGDRYGSVVEAVRQVDDPIVAYRFGRHVEGRDPSSADLQGHRERIADTPLARGLLDDLAMLDPSDPAAGSPISLTLRYLAEIDYPPGDAELTPYREAAHAWLRRLEHDYDGKLLIRDRHRVHASFHANVIHADVALGLADDETDRRAENLLRYQWPGGGWNCNKKPATRGPTIVHTAWGLRGLVTYRERRPTRELEAAIAAAAEVVLDRRIHLRRSTGEPLRPVYTKLSYPYPRLYDAMAGLHILTRSGHLADPRCDPALDLLESKFVDGEGWPTERRLFSHVEGKDDFTHAPWGEPRLGKANPLLTVDALEILGVAGRLEV